MRTRRCPICGEAAASPEANEFPFCSERCRLLDLGNWLGEDYRVADPYLSGAPQSEDDWREG
ncbi:MAG: DNA gyrase inhibitor YacG [Myxococcota bacterium]